MLVEVVRESCHELNPSDDQNCEQHVGDESLKGGEEVAVIPPVSGG